MMSARANGEGRTDVYALGHNEIAEKPRQIEKRKEKHGVAGHAVQQSDIPDMANPQTCTGTLLAALSMAVVPENTGIPRVQQLHANLLAPVMAIPRRCHRRDHRVIRAGHRDRRGMCRSSQAVANARPADAFPLRNHNPLLQIFGCRRSVRPNSWRRAASTSTSRSIWPMTWTWRTGAATISRSTARATS